MMDSDGDGLLQTEKELKVKLGIDIRISAVKVRLQNLKKPWLFAIFSTDTTPPAKIHTQRVFEEEAFESI